MSNLKIFSLTDALRMCLQIKNLFGIIIIITALTIEKKNQFGVGLDQRHCTSKRTKIDYI